MKKMTRWQKFVEFLDDYLPILVIFAIIGGGGYYIYLDETSRAIERSKLPLWQSEVKPIVGVKEYEGCTYIKLTYNGEDNQTFHTISCPTKEVNVTSDCGKNCKKTVKTKKLKK